MTADEIALEICRKLGISPQSPTLYEQGEHPTQAYKYIAYVIRWYGMAALHDSHIAEDANKEVTP